MRTVGLKRAFVVSLCSTLWTFPHPVHCALAVVDSHVAYRNDPELAVMLEPRRPALNCGDASPWCVIGPGMI
jgi:hypothetical protein